MRKWTLGIAGLALVGTAVAVFSFSNAVAGDHAAKGAQVGQPAPTFNLTAVRTGEPVSLDQFADQNVVLVWQSINCPWDKMREDGGYQRVLSPLAEKYQDKGIVFLAINSNKTESVEEIAAYATKHNIPYPILKDLNNVVADTYGAKTTPHIYIKGKDGTLVYKGGLEEVPTSPGKCGEMDVQYLVPVLDALLAGETLPFTSTESKGCSIKRVN
ncbi:MAG: redoxin domain-containing protein [Planctomycetota bacterium]